MGTIAMGAVLCMQLEQGFSSGGEMGAVMVEWLVRQAALWRDAGLVPWTSLDMFVGEDYK